MSGSWDRTVKLWDVFEHKGNKETLLHSADGEKEAAYIISSLLFFSPLHFTVICVVFRPDGVELAVSSLDGQLSFWNVANAVQTGSIEGRHDLEVGRREWDKVTAKTLTGGM